jgi:hypothetical protein
MAYDFSDYVQHTLWINDAKLAADLTAALDTLYADMMATNPNQIGDSAQAIKVEQGLIQLQHDLSNAYNAATRRRSLLYYIDIKRDLDFRGGDPAFSVTPRLLFRVPEKKRSADTQLPLRLKPIGNNFAPGLTRANVTDKTALVYSNQEGIEEKIEDRPVVQECAVSPGDFVIIGKVGMAGRAAVWKTVADIMHVPDGQNPFAYYDEHGAVEDLGAILDSLRAQGFGNQYDTSDSYRKKLETIEPLPDQPVNPEQVSGFYAKPADKTEATLRYVPGDVMLVGSGHAHEVINGGGFALYETSNGAERFAPLSRAYAKLSMIFKRSCDAVAPEKQAAPLLFSGDHVLRDFSVPVAKFLNIVSQINRQYAPKAAPDEGFAPGMVPGLA